MNDYEYEFKQDIKEKKSVGRNSRYMNRTGKGPIKFPSDYLSNKEKKKLNGPVVSYDMGKPMSYADFRKMPEEMQKMYLEGIVNKFHPTFRTISELFGIGESTLYYRMKQLGVKTTGAKGVLNKDFDEKAWDAWIADGKLPEESGKPKKIAKSHTEKHELEETVPLVHTSGVVIPDVMPEPSSKVEPVEEFTIPSIPTDISFKTIAFMWSSYLENRPAPIKPEDVAAMFAILQMVNISSGKATKEDWEELSRYALLASKII